MSAECPQMLMTCYLLIHLFISVEFCIILECNVIELHAVNYFLCPCWLDQKGMQRMTHHISREQNLSCFDRSGCSTLP